MVSHQPADLWFSLNDHLFLFSDGEIFTAIALFLGAVFLFWIWNI